MNDPIDDKPKLPAATNHMMVSWEKLLPALLVVLVISVGSVLAINALGGAEVMRSIVSSAGPWSPLVFVLLKASTYVFAPLSGTPLKLVAGAVFGVWEGLVLSLVGDVLGGTLNFWIARIFGRPGISRFVGAKAIRQVDETIEHAGGWRALLVARVVLSSLYDFISYAAGLSRLSFRQYFWVTVVGGVPSALLFVFIGDALITGPYAIWVLSGSVALVAGLLLSQRLVGKKKGRHEDS